MHKSTQWRPYKFLLGYVLLLCYIHINYILSIFIKMPLSWKGQNNTRFDVSGKTPCLTNFPDKELCSEHRIKLRCLCSEWNVYCILTLLCATNTSIYTTPFNNSIIVGQKVINYFVYLGKVSFDFKLTTKKFLTTEISISITWQTLTHQKIVLKRNGQDTNIKFL